MPIPLVVIWILLWITTPILFVYHYLGYFNGRYTRWSMEQIVARANTKEI